MQAQRQPYATARLVLKILEVVGWLIVICGGIVLVLGLFALGEMGLMALAPGPMMMAMGILMAANAQIGHAFLDTADYTRGVLQIMLEWQPQKAGLTSPSHAPEPSRRAPSAPAAMADPPTIGGAAEIDHGVEKAAAPPVERRPPVDENALTGMIKHDGKEVRFNRSRTIVHVGEKRFGSIEEAKAFIDSSKS